MPLNAPRLAIAMEPGILAAFVSSGAIPGAALTALVTNLSNAIAATVILEITANALVVPTAMLSGAPGSPVTGVGSVT